MHICYIQLSFLIQQAGVGLAGVTWKPSQRRNFAYVAGGPGQSFCANSQMGILAIFSGLSRLLQICIYGPLLKASLVRRSSGSCLRVRLRGQHPFNLDSSHNYSTVISVQRSIAYIAGGESFTMGPPRGLNWGSKSATPETILFPRHTILQ